MLRQRFLLRLTSILVICSLLLSNAPLALGQDGPVYLPLVNNGQGRPVTPASDLIFRVQVRVATPSQAAKLAQPGIVVLAQTEDAATLLVDAAQLEYLARAGFQPRGADALEALVKDQGPEWLSPSLQPLLQEAAAARQHMDATVGRAGDQTEALASVRAAMSVLVSEQRAALNELTELDSDGDGLTDTEESWWCTDALNPNSDGDAQGYSDGLEVDALLDVTLPRNVRWGYGPPFGPPAAWPDFNNRDGNPATPACNDGDWDTIPDYAEAYLVGTRVGGGDSESTDHDKFDDGQELFGITYCPGGDLSCGYGAYPRPEYWNFIKSSMPNWVLPPGDSPFVAAFPVPEVSVEASSWVIERVTTITTSQGEMVQKTDTVETSVTRGQSTSIANTVTWNEWEEVSQAVERPLTGAAIRRVRPRSLNGADWSWESSKMMGSGLFAAGAGALGTGVLLAGFGAACIATVACAVGVLAGTALTVVGTKMFEDGWDDTFNKDERETATQTNIYNSSTSSATASASASAQASVVVNNNLDFQGVVNSLDGVTYAINQQGQLIANGLQDISYQISRPRLTETKTSGKSWGGAQTTTHEVYEEHTISQGEAFTTGQNWSTAWAVDSSHAADLTFRYSVRNAGTEYARELSNLVFNIYIGDDTLPTISYPAWEQFAGGKLDNLFPVGPNTPPGVVSSKTFASKTIPLSLEQMKRIDLGERLTVKVENYSYGADELFYVDAIAGGVTVYIEDGVEDGDETVDQYVIPTWGAESVQDVLARYFPYDEDIDGDLNSLWTPEFNGVGAPTWHEHYLSDIAWWNVYLTQLDAGDTPLGQLPAQAGAGVLFRFNRDSDRDGYNDRAEYRYYCALPAGHVDRPRCADGHLRPEIHPQPEVLAGYVVERNGNVATVKLALENTGTFDAYGIDAVMYSPDATTTIGNNTVGGNGKVRPGNKVTVGSMIKAPDLSNWGASRARPYAAGEYSGAVDRTFTFTAQTPGVVGTGSTAVAWNDGAGASGVLQLGGSYHAPLPLDVAHGVQVGFNTGAIDAGARFTVQALTSRDTFTYTINSEPFMPPVIVVSYSDPQGSHRFVTPVQMPWLGDSLAPHANAMLKGIGLQIVATAPFAATGANTTNLVVYNPHPATIVDGHLHLNFVSDGKLVLEKSFTLDIPAGPTTLSAVWSVSEFSADYKPNGDNLLIAFWTDSENNIIDSAARPLNSFAADPKPAAASDAAAWDFGTVTQSEVLKRKVSVASVGALDLLAYVSASPGLAASQVGSRPLGLSDVTSYELTLDTRTLPTGPYSGTVTLRTSDPANPLYTVQVSGVIAPVTGDAYARTVTDRPLDIELWVPGNRALSTSIFFDHALQPNPEQIHPIKVFGLGQPIPYGVGRVIAAPTVTGITINATVLGVDAGCQGDFGIYSPINQPIFQNYHAYIGHTRSVSYSGNPQNELYYIWGGSCYGGPHLSNSERARITQESADSWVIRWDDSLGDRDYNDLVVRVTRSLRVEDFFIIEQTAPSTTRLVLPKPTSEVRTYVLQYGYKLDYNAAGEMATTLRVPAGIWTAASLDALISGVGSADVTFKLDVGADGVWDWEQTRSVANAATVSSPNLAAAFAPYVNGAGQVDVPIKVYLSKPGQVLLTNMSVTRNQAIDLAPAFALSGSPTEGTVVSLNATVANSGAADSGPLTVSYFATRPSLLAPQYIGSVFVTNVQKAGAVTAPLQWNTFGFTGPVTVTAHVDPYNRTVETNETNNQAAATFTILTRPDLTVPAIALSDPEPLAGQPVTVTVTLRNGGQTPGNSQVVTLYNGNPAQGGAALGSRTVSIPANATRTAAFTWTPPAAGPYRLLARVDRTGVVNEFDESNNDTWFDFHVGLASPVLLDSGATGEPAYTPARGYGFVDEGLPDRLGACGANSQRRDPGGELVYRFDHLQPGHYYHLDLEMTECDQARRTQTVYIDGHAVAAPETLGDQQTHRLSILIDPALYADRAIRVTVAAADALSAIVDRVALHDIDYRYADAGAATEPQCTAGASYGWIDGDPFVSWGKLPYQSFRTELDDNQLRYCFKALDPAKRYRLHLSFWQASGVDRLQTILLDGVPAAENGNVISGQRRNVTVPLEQSAYQQDRQVDLSILRTNAGIGALVNLVVLEEETLAPTAPAPTGYAVLALTPATASMGQGQTASMDIWVRTTQPVDSSSAYLNFDPAYLQVASITPGSSFPVILQNSYDNSNGRIDFAAGALTGAAFSSDLLLATVVFTGVTTTPGTAVSFASTPPRRSDVTYAGAPVFSHAENGSIIVTQDVATLAGSVSLEGRPAPPHAQWRAPLRVTLSTAPGGPPLASFAPTSDENGAFVVSGISPGVYSVGVKMANSLRSTVVVTFTNAQANIDFGLLPGGDADDDNYVTVRDFSILRTGYGKCQGDSGFDGRADFNGDSCVLMVDFSILRKNFGGAGDALRGSGAPINAVEPLAELRTEPSTSAVAVGEQVTVLLKVDAGEMAVDGAAAYLTFDPAVVQVVGVTAGDALPDLLQNEADNQAGALHFAAGGLEQTASGIFDLATVELRAVGPGEAKLRFAQDSPSQSDVTAAGMSVLSSVVNAAVTVQAPGETESTPSTIFLPIVGGRE